MADALHEIVGDIALDVQVRASATALVALLRWGRPAVGRRLGEWPRLTAPLRVSRQSQLRRFGHEDASALSQAFRAADARGSQHATREQFIDALQAADVKLSREVCVAAAAQFGCITPFLAAHRSAVSLAACAGRGRRVLLVCGQRVARRPLPRVSPPRRPPHAGAAALGRLPAGRQREPGPAGGVNEATRRPALPRRFPAAAPRGCGQADAASEHWSQPRGRRALDGALPAAARVAAAAHWTGSGHQPAQHRRHAARPQRRQAGVPGGGAQPADRARQPPSHSQDSRCGPVQGAAQAGGLLPPTAQERAADAEQESPGAGAGAHHAGEPGETSGGGPLPLPMWTYLYLYTHTHTDS